MRLKLKILIKFIFEKICANAWLKNAIRKMLNRDYEIDSATLEAKFRQEINKNATQGDFIVSLTTMPSRINILKYALHSIFMQDLRPKKVVLYLSKDEFLEANGSLKLPSDVEKFMEFGLEISWVAQNLRQYNKIIHALREYPREVMITVDDDIYYPQKLFFGLYEAHLRDKGAIWAQRARKVAFDGEKIGEFFDWNLIKKRDSTWQNTPKFNIFLEGCGGVLYPPNALFSDATNEKLFFALSPKADDLWLWAMAVLNGTKIAVVPQNLMGDGNGFTNAFSAPALWYENMMGGNDRQVSAIVAQYPQILARLREDWGNANLVESNNLKTPPPSPSPAKRKGEDSSCGASPQPPLTFLQSKKVSKKIDSHEATASATLKSVVGEGERLRGGGSDFAIQAPPPLAKMRAERISSKSRNGRNMDSFGESINSKDSRESVSTNPHKIFSHQNPPKVLQFGKFFPPDVGGIETVMQDLTLSLNEKGIPCDVLCSNSALKYSEEILPCGAKIMRTASFGRIASTSLSPQMITKLRAIIARYDIIHLHLPDPMANLALLLAQKSRYAGKKIILHWHSDIIRQKNLLRLYAPMQRKLLHLADAIITTSPRYIDGSPTLQEFAHKVVAIPIGVKSVYKPDSPLLRSHFRARIARKAIFSIGRMVAYKGFEFLIEAMQFLEDYTLYIAGDGDLMEDLRAKIYALGLESRVFLLGKLDNATRGAHYNNDSIFVLPSINRSEAFGVVQIEAMSCFMPVVSTNIKGSGVPWVNENGVSGLVIAPCDAKAIAKAVRKIERNYEKFAKGAYQRYLAHFTKDKMIERTINLYKEIYQY